VSKQSSFCDGMKRRDVLRVGTAGFFSLPQLLQSQIQGAEGNSKSDVSLILVFLNGGLSTIDTLDNKPSAPAEFRGDFKPVDSNVPGMQLCEHLPLLSQECDKFSLLRSFTHSNSSHGHADHYMLTGYHPRAGFNSGLKPNNQKPSHGSIIAHMKGPKGSVPPYVSLPRMHNSGGSAFLGSSAAPFVVESDPNAPNFSVPDLAPPLEVGFDRLNDRKLLLSQIDRFKKSAEIQANKNAKTLSTFQKKAFQLVTSPETKSAFDISKEPDALRDAYGRHSLGQACLMARRLIEAGVRCVHVDHSNWDTHYNNFDVLKKDLLPQLDSALSVLFSDLYDRGMLKKTFVLVMGEFGRTPRVNKFAGRDHWGPSNAILLGGGGIAGGRVIGATNSKGEKPAADPVGPEDLAATMYRCLGIDPNYEFYTPDGRPVTVVNDGKTITELLS